MKATKIVTLFILFLLNIKSLSAQSSVNKIFKQIKSTERYKGASIPKWAIRLAISVASKSDDKDLQGLLTIGKKIKKIRFATTTLDAQKHNTKALVHGYAKFITKKDHFEEYISVKSEDQNLKIMVQENEDVISNLVIMSEENGHISFVHLKANLTYDDLRQISFSNVTEDIKNIKIETN